MNNIFSDYTTLIWTDPSDSDFDLVEISYIGYRDGVAVESIIITPPMSIVNGANLFMGIEANENHPFSGIIDEVSITREIRTADIMYAQYFSMSDNFITYGTPRDAE